MKAESLTTTQSSNPNEDHHLIKSRCENLKTCNPSCHYQHHCTCNAAGLMAHYGLMPALVGSPQSKMYEH
jgi:hypothetical protein